MQRLSRPIWPLVCFNFLKLCCQQLIFCQWISAGEALGFLFLLSRAGYQPHPQSKKATTGNWVLAKEVCRLHNFLHQATIRTLCYWQYSSNWSQLLSSVSLCMWNWDGIFSFYPASKHLGPPDDYGRDMKHAVNPEPSCWKESMTGCNGVVLASWTFKIHWSFSSSESCLWNFISKGSASTGSDIKIFVFLFNISTKGRG